MQLSKIFVPALFLVFTGVALAQPQPAEPAKKESSEAMIARFEVERKARAMSDFKKGLQDKFKLTDDDINAVQLFMARQDAQVKIVRAALYQVTLAEDDAEVSDDEYAVFWNDFETLLAKYRAQKAEDATKLGEQLHLDKNLRLQSFLTMRGIIGDDLLGSTPMSETFAATDMLEYHLKREMGADKPHRVVPDDKANG